MITKGMYFWGTIALIFMVFQASDIWVAVAISAFILYGALDILMRELTKILK